MEGSQTLVLNPCQLTPFPFLTWFLVSSPSSLWKQDLPLTSINASSWHQVPQRTEKKVQQTSASIC